MNWTQRSTFSLYSSMLVLQKHTLNFTEDYRSNIWQFPCQYQLQNSRRWRSLLQLNAADCRHDQTMCVLCDT